MWPIQLPYGLSDHHRHARATDKAVPIPCGVQSRWHVLTLHQISCASSSTTNTWPDPHRLTTPNSPSSGKHSKNRRTSPHDHDMGVAAFRHSKSAPQAANRKRRKLSKLQSRHSSAVHKAITSTTAQKKKRRLRGPRPLGPGTRPGAHQQLPISIDSDDEVNSGASPNSQQRPFIVDSDDDTNPVASLQTRPLPITIDSDDDTASVASLETSASAAVRIYTLPAISSRPTSNSPVSKTDLSHNPRLGSSMSSSPVAQHNPSKTPKPFALPLHPARRHHSKTFEERLVSVEPLEQHSPHVQGRPAPRALAPITQRTIPRETLSSPASSYADDGQLTLADITDFTLRQKTAQLMAVAPGLPVADLYHLLMDRRGHFEAAKRDVIRQSQKPSTLSPTRKLLAQERAATVPLTASVDDQDQVKDEPYIKIDFDDPDLVFDNDAPREPTPGLKRRKLHSQARSANTAQKPKAKPTKKLGKAARPSTAGCSVSQSQHSPPAIDKAPSASTPKPRPTLASALVPRKGYAVKVCKGKGAGDVNRGLRATSYDLEFIVSEDEVLENSDETYSESNQSHTSDVDMTDDGTDLHIDMQPEYAYNSDVLTSPSPT